jgi:hypothetical protein
VSVVALNLVLLLGVDGPATGDSVLVDFADPGASVLAVALERVTRTGVSGSLSDDAAVVDFLGGILSNYNSRSIQLS